MNKIISLHRDVYAKIAAGEVIERPLSIVKELLENSIDAGADHIEVEINRGGKERIRVGDNGEGFSADDLEKAFERHATSKLRELSDLDRLNTLGFRGEALPSILEVADVEVISADNENGAGWRCLFQAGLKKVKEPAACNRGALVEVSNVFVHLPVRRKFLKSDQAEFRYIAEFCEQIALAYPAISLNLFHNGRPVFSWEKCHDLSQRVFQVLGSEALARMEYLDYREEPYHLRGYVSKAGQGVSSRKQQFFIVNGRVIREKTLLAALRQVFLPFLERDRHPLAVILFDLPPAEIDVNIHPAKLEIQFQNPSFVFSLLTRAINTVLQPANKKIPDQAKRIENGRGDFACPIRETEAVFFQERELFKAVQENTPDFRVIGQLWDSYLLVERQDELLLIDQHNAHESVLFERCRDQGRRGEIESVQPLFPLLLEVSALDRDRLESGLLAALSPAGFEIEMLSGKHLEIKAYPAVVEERQVKDFFSALLAMDGREEDFLDRIYAEAACHRAVKVNTPLNSQEQWSLTRDYLQLKNPHLCPHQRPIVISQSKTEVEKKLGRR